MSLDNVVELNKERIVKLEKLSALRIEEEAKMSERFKTLIDGQKQLFDKVDILSAQVMEVRDVAMKNSHDLNNGLKSEVGKIAKAVTKNSDHIRENEKELSDHCVDTMDPDEIENLIHRVVAESAKQRREEKREEGSNRIGVWAIIIAAAVTVGGALIEWLLRL
jgi:hypothetical protein